MSIIYIGDHRIATGSSDKLIIIWNVVTKYKISSFLSHNLDVCCLLFKNDYIISGSYDRSIKFFDLNGNVICCLNDHKQRILSLTLINNDQILVSTSKDNSLIIWNLN